MPDIQVLGIIATAVIGAAGIVATHVYHVRGNQAQRTIFKKLPGAIVEILKQDLREKLSIQELNELIHQKSVDEDAGGQGDPLPYKACPRCGNTDLSRGMIEGPRDHIYYIIECKECRWSEWTE